MMKQPLEGIRVVATAVAFAGPYATMLLADLGAEIILVESIAHFPPLTRGTMARPGPSAIAGGFGTQYPNRDPGERPWNRFAIFNVMARNKLSMTADLTQPKGKQIFKDLVQKSDIFIENYSAGAIDRLGLGYSVLKEVKPDLIMISMPSFGNSGPYKDYRGMGNVVEALVGHTWLRGYPDSDPTLTGTPALYADASGATLAAFAALIALHYRNETGEGQFIDLSQSECMIPHLAEFVLDYTMNQREREPMGNRSPFIAPQGCYRCQGNDRWVNISITSDEQWGTLCRVLGNPEMAQDERFSDVRSRQKNHDEIDRLIEEWTSLHEPYKIMHLLQKEGIPCGPVLSEADALSDPHLRERGFFLEVSHPEAGTHDYPGFAWKLSETPSVLKGAPPCLGQHNDYVYREILGKSEEEIAQLEEENHIGTEYLPHIM